MSLVGKTFYIKGSESYFYRKVARYLKMLNNRERFTQVTPTLRKKIGNKTNLSPKNKKIIRGLTYLIYAIKKKHGFKEKPASRR